MKTAFKILPGNDNNNNDLLIEAGRDCISMLWYSPADMVLQGFAVYQPDISLNEEQTSREIQQLLASENLAHYRNCRIFLNYKESVIVPTALQNNQGKSSLLDLVYGWDETAVIGEENMNTVEAMNVYRAPSLLKQQLSDRFYGASIQHSNSCQVAAGKDCNLYCIIYPGTVKIILHIEGKLQLVQLYDYKSPADVSYYLLQVCQQHQLEPSTASLRLAGFIDRDSQLFQEIYRYFLDVELKGLPDDIKLSEALETLPVQFFSFLIPLLQCES